MLKQHFGFSVEIQPYFSPSQHRFHFNRIEDYRGILKLPLPPHRKTVYDFLFLTQGMTKRSKGLDEYELTENTFFFLPAYQITAHEFMSENARGYFCHFDPGLFTKTSLYQDVFTEFPFLQFVGNPIVKIDEEAFEPIINLLKRLENEYKNERTDKLNLVRVYLLALFTELKRFTQPTEKITVNAAFRITQLYKNALSHAIYEKHSVAAYADLLSVSPNHLNKCVHAATGKSAHDLLDEMILLEAKVLLKQTDLTISEIAYKVGEKGSSNFSRFFRTKTGVTPKEYRELD